MIRTSNAYSAGQAAKAAGLAYHQLNHLAMLGIVIPSIDAGEGYGGVRAYSLADVVALAAISRMKSSGFALGRLQELASKIQNWNEGSSKTYFVGDENGSVEVFDEQHALAALRAKDRKGLTWLLDIQDIADDMKSRLQSTSRSPRGKSVRVA